MPHWTDELTHQDLVTPEAKATLSKYNTAEDAHVGGLHAMRDYGKPFKLPKSLESLPDDAVRADFTSQTKALLGTIPYDEAQLDTVNYADGLADARTVNEKFKGVLTEFAKKTKMPIAQVQELVGAYNAFSTEFLNEHNAAQAKTKTDTATKVNESLKTLFGGDEGVKTNTENVRRMFKDHAGLTAEEYEQTAPALIESGITGSAVLSKALFNLAKPFAESKTDIIEPGGGKKEEGESDINEEMPATAKELGW